jgi:hypothetical protein
MVSMVQQQAILPRFFTAICVGLASLILDSLLLCPFRDHPSCRRVLMESTIANGNRMILPIASASDIDSSSDFICFLQQSSNELEKILP